jgi:2-oxoisovalerate dehydrogenase E1 component alpha subunit
VADILRDDVGVQLIDPSGRRTPNADYDRHVAHLPAGDLVGLYEDMVVVRRLDRESEALQRQGQLGLWPSLLGQEAAQVGAGRALMPADFVFPTYREHGIAYTRGVDWVDMLRFWRGTHVGAWEPRRHGINTYSVIIPAQTLHAVGYAMGIQRDTGGAATLACFGDGATAQGDLAEAFVWASVFTAPVVFLCQNNQWAISEPLERQTRVPLYQRAAGHGFPGIRVDGNDVLAVIAVVGAALERARRGEGPTLVEAFTYRMGAHTTSDDPTKYRSAELTEEWSARDPIQRFRTWLRSEGVLTDAQEAAVQSAADDAAARLRDGCHSLPEPRWDSIFDHVYAEARPLLERQRAEHAALRATFEEAQA